MASYLLPEIGQALEFQAKLFQIGEEAEDGLQLAQGPILSAAIQLEFGQIETFKRRLQVEGRVTVASQLGLVDVRHPLKQLEGRSALVRPLVGNPRE